MCIVDSNKGAVPDHLLVGSPIHIFGKRICRECLEHNGLRNLAARYLLGIPYLPAGLGHQTLVRGRNLAGGPTWLFGSFDTRSCRWPGSSLLGQSSFPLVRPLQTRFTLKATAPRGIRFSPIRSTSPRH